MTRSRKEFDHEIQRRAALQKSHIEHPYLHYVQTRYRIVASQYLIATKAVCGDPSPYLSSDVSSLITCPACRYEIRLLEINDPTKLKMIELAWWLSDRKNV